MKSTRLVDRDGRIDDPAEFARQLVREHPVKRHGKLVSGDE
jgi:hypothetical protein